ncbi:MAG TPA: heparinase II/III family protein [Streptosporangiaceae bacterium]|nr:heparinase II/III family protein [Streptosporangiaceae bacterium]
MAALVIGSAACGGAGTSSATARGTSSTQQTRQRHQEVPANPGGRPGSVTAADHARACGQPRSLTPAGADEIMAGRLTVSNFAPVRIDPHRNGRVNWSQDPYHHPSWRVAFLSGGWINVLVARYLAAPARSEAYRKRAAALLRGWLRTVPMKYRSAGTLVCAAQIFPGRRWIERQIPRHVDYHAAHWEGPWNHGLRQDLELLRIGCGYPAAAWGGRPLKWRATARRQLISAFAPNPLGPAVDRQGVANEQSTGYARVVYSWWTVAGQWLAACPAAPLPRRISGRIARIPAFLAHAMQPDGRLVQLGDTYEEGAEPVRGTPLEYAATRGASGSPPGSRVAVYAAGFAFGRSGWGTSRSFGAESFYSLRFGRGRQIHGHNDHMSLTYFARGRNLIVDAGHTGYENGAYRAYLRSPEAHNVLTMPGMRFSQAARTRLIRRVARRDGQFFAFTDTAYRGHRRHRGVYVSQRPDFVVVFDRAAGAGRYQQLWHLDPGLRITAVRRTYAVAAAAGTQLLVRQIPLPGQRVSSMSTTVVRGRTRPYQGWVSRKMRSRVPAPVVTMTRRGSGVAILTLIAPTKPGAAVRATATRRPNGGLRLRVRIGGQAVSLLIRPGGTITRG